MTGVAVGLLTYADEALVAEARNDGKRGYCWVFRFLEMKSVISLVSRVFITKKIELQEWFK